MFKHKINAPASTPVIPTTKEESLSGHFEGERDRDPSSATASLGMTNKTSSTETAKSDSSLKELIEKNLKWSQIIYEQNRKINNKLLWSAIFSWFKIIIIVGPIIWGIIYFQPILKGVWAQYNELLGSAPTTGGSFNTNSLDSLLKLFNLDPAKQEQLKALLK